MSTSSSNLRYALRSLARNPAYTIAATLTLGLGLGATAAIYTLIQRVVLDPLPYPKSAQLVRIVNPVPGVDKAKEWSLSEAQFFYYREHVPALAELGTYRLTGVNIATSGEPARGHQAIVTAGMIRLLGARATLGRLIGDRDDVPEAAPVAVISDRLWRSQFSGDPAVIGRTLRLDDTPFVIIGVMASGVDLPPDRGEAFPVHADVWTAMRFNPEGPFYNNHAYPAIARLADGATLDQAQRQVDGLLHQLPEQFPNAYSEQFFQRYGFHTKLYSLKAYVVGEISKSLWILFGAVTLVLVIACANVGNLFLVRLEGRRREFAVRTALGAGRRAIAAGAFSEGLVLAVAGALVAFLLSIASARGLVSIAPPGIPRLEVVGADWRALALALVLASAIAAVLSLVATAQHKDVQGGLGSLGDGGRSATAGVERQRLRGTLVVTQMALALMLVVGATLLVQSFQRLRSIDPGIDARGVLTFEWYLPPQRYDSLTKVWRFEDAVLSKIRAIPGVLAAGGSEELPLLTGFGCTVQGFEDGAPLYQRLKDSGLTTCAGQGTTTPGYFESLRIPLVRGRYLEDADNEAPERGAVVVTKAFAERFWGTDDVIGKGVAPNGRSKPPFYHVVGVVGDLHGDALNGPAAMGIFYPVVAIPGTGRWYPDEAHVVVRTTRADPVQLLPAIRRIVSEVDPSIPIANAVSMQSIVDRSMGRLSFTMALLGIAGAVALALAAIGLYGLISYLVARRTNEIGVRIALGAQPRQVEQLVVGNALKLAGLGVAIGIAGAAVSARVLGALLYGVAPWDPVSYAGAVGVLVVVAGCAAWLPARRAARVDPAVALRAE